MSCPKCGTTKGFYHYDSIGGQTFPPDGLSCCMCGFWLDAATLRTHTAAQRSPSRRR